MSEVTTSVRLDRIPEVRQDTGEPYEHIVLPYLVLLPLMNLIACYVFIKKQVLRLFWGLKPRINFWLVDGVSVTSRRIKEGATTWRALDEVYNFKQGQGRTAFTRAFDSMWLHIRNAQAPRNRLVMAKQTLRESIVSIAEDLKPGEPVRILSLAAGSSQGVIEVMAEMRRRGIRVQSFLIDLEADALHHARRLAHEHGVEDDVLTERGDVFRFRKLLGEFTPHIVEIMGLVDYLNKRQAVWLMEKIYEVLPPNGFFFASNVHPNSESFFLKWVVDWDMFYRTRQELGELLAAAGFPNPHVATEPHRIQSFAVARKIA